MLHYTLLYRFKFHPIHQHVLNYYIFYDRLRCTKTVVLPVVLYECKTWSLTLREERRLRMLENRVPRKTFGPKSYEVTGEWRKPHNEELIDLYCSPNIFRVITSRRMRMARLVARSVGRSGVYRVLMGKPEGKKPIWRPRRRWEDNIKIDLQEVGYGGNGQDWSGSG